MVATFVFRCDKSGIEDTASSASLPAPGVVVPCSRFPPLRISGFPSFSFLDLLERIQFDTLEAMASINGIDEGSGSCTAGGYRTISQGSCG